MPSRKRVSVAPNAGLAGDDGAVSSGAALDAGLTAALAEAEEALALAEARAVAARRRAKVLSAELEAIAGEQAEAVEPRAVEDEPKTPSTTSSVARSRGRWLRRPQRKTVLYAGAALLTCGSLALSGLLWSHHRAAEKERQRTAEFVAVARQDALLMMGISADKARDDIQHIIDASTGQFKASMLLAGEDLVKSVEDSKVNTKVKIEGVAVESMTNDSAVVMVAAKAEATSTDNKPPRPPRHWRMVMTLKRDGGELKIAGIETLP
jgi:Mce-associated membrane protein